MAVGLVWRRELIEAVFFTRPLDTEIITARVGVPHVDVGDFRITEQLVQLGLAHSVLDMPLSDETSAGRIGVEGEAVREHVRWKSRVFGVSLAFVLVDE